MALEETHDWQEKYENSAKRTDALKSVLEEMLNLCDSGDLIASTFDASKRVYETKEKARKVLSGL